MSASASPRSTGPAAFLRVPQVIESVAHLDAVSTKTIDALLASVRLPQVDVRTSRHLQQVLKLLDHHPLEWALDPVIAERLWTL